MELFQDADERLYIRRRSADHHHDDHQHEQQQEKEEEEEVVVAEVTAAAVEEPEAEAEGRGGKATPGKTATEKGGCSIERQPSPKLA
jgi:hypothetical protein